MAKLDLKEDIQRRYDLDWIRVIAMFCLLLFHCGMLFVAEWTWHIQNQERSNLFLEWMFFMSGWRMSLLFIVSGAGTYFALRSRSSSQYMLERGKRLIIPLVFGMLVIVPPQLYIERISLGQFDGTYLQFWPAIFTLTPYPEGNISWHHLWFIFYLFIFSIIALPIFKWINNGSTFLDSLAKKHDLFILFFFGLVYAFIYAIWTIPFPGPQNLINDWGRFFSYLTLFIFGYIWFIHKALGDRLFGLRHIALRLGLITLLFINVFRWTGLEPVWEYDMAQIAFMMVRGMSGFCWAIAFLGYARQFLSRGSRFLSYANEAVYPFYIIHQTIIIIIGYKVIQVDDDILSKYIFIVVSSFIVTITLYECFVRPWPKIRILFGMKSSALIHNRMK
jgi:hypothetical protein